VNQVEKGFGFKSNKKMVQIDQDIRPAERVKVKQITEKMKELQKMPSQVSPVVRQLTTNSSLFSLGIRRMQFISTDHQQGLLPTENHHSLSVVDLTGLKVPDRVNGLG